MPEDRSDRADRSQQADEAEAMRARRRAALELTAKRYSDLLMDSDVTESEPGAFDGSGWPAKLVRLVVTSDGLEDVLPYVATATAAAMPPGTSCSIAVELPDETPVVAGSDDVALTVGKIDCTHYEGPCVEARRTGRAVYVPDLVCEPRRWASALEALAHGIRGFLVIPVHGSAGAVGTLTLYADEPGAFDEPVRRRAQAIADGVGDVITLALRHTVQARLIDDLRGALDSRSVIDQAIGIVMAQNRCDRKAAFAVLRRASQNRNVKVRDIAADIIRSVTGEHPSSGPFEPRR